MTKTYAGIGSRDTPKDILRRMTNIAYKLQEKGYTLLSGGADGADTAFELGAGKLKEIYLPWNNFNGHEVDNINYFLYKDEATEIAKKFHPVWNELKSDLENYILEMFTKFLAKI